VPAWWRKVGQLRSAFEAVKLYNRGNALLREGLLEEARQAFDRAVTLDAGNKDAWFNLSLVHKRLHQWEECLRCTERVVALDPSEDGAWWNMGIAATALRDWPAARRGWRGHGITLPEDDGPIEGNFGITPVRLDPDGSAEVVWCQRIDPARALIRSIPLPESGHRWGDIILHDGEPKGERIAFGRTYPVFDELERWQPSETPTLRVEVVAGTPADSESLVDLFDRNGLAAEDWSGNIRRLCRACSEGSPHGEHDAAAGEWQPGRDFGLAALPQLAEELLSRWGAEGAERRYGAIEIVA
jgi:hypothetical protein